MDDQIVPRQRQFEFGDRLFVKVFQRSVFEIVAKFDDRLFGISYHHGIAILFRDLGDQTDHRTAHKDDFPSFFKLGGNIFAAVGGVSHAADADHVGVGIVGDVLDGLDADLAGPAFRKQRRKHGIGESYEIQFALFDDFPFVVVNGRLNEQNFFIHAFFSRYSVSE